MITNKTHYSLMNMHVNKTHNSTKNRNKTYHMHVNYTHEQKEQHKVGLSWELQTRTDYCNGLVMCNA